MQTVACNSVRLCHSIPEPTILEEVCLLSQSPRLEELEEEESKINASKLRDLHILPPKTAVSSK